jgi:putative nucleotidyltransferase with HDIG domain
MEKDIFEKIKKIVESEENCTDVGHNMEHTMRVFNMAVHLAEGENVDLEVIESSALLHDIGGQKEIQDVTGKTDHAIEGAEMV